MAHRLLRHNGVDPFVPDKHERNALFYACKRLNDKLVSKLLRMAGDDGPKLLNAFDKKHELGQNCITAILASVNHSIVSKKPKGKEVDAEDDDEDNQPNFGFYQNNSSDDSSDPAGWQFDASAHVKLLKKMAKKYDGIFRKVSLSMGVGGEEGKGVLEPFKRIHKDNTKKGDYCYYYQYLFEKLMMPEYWAERAGLKGKYETQAVVYAGKANNYELLAFLLKYAKLTAEAVDSNNRSALSWAVMHNSYPMVELILSNVSP